MTPATAKRINGCDIVEIHPRTWAAIDSSMIRATTERGPLTKAVDILVAEIYRQNKAIAIQRAGYRCTRCGDGNHLQAHHRDRRGVGKRDDRPEALEIVCADCHRKEHGGY
jgi:5-methylcytosine-specific restriction endonuclease McrA